MEKKEIKILYHGPGLSGRHSNLEYIYSKVFDSKLKSFDYQLFKLNIGQIKNIVGKHITHNESVEQIFAFGTAPMSRWNDPYREMLIKEMDAFVFVVDSQLGRMDANIETLWETETVLEKYNRNIKDLPWVIQYNKRDLPNILSVEQLQKEFNHYQLPYFESVAYKGIGVFETFVSFVNELDKFYNIFD
jgi:signal recognition particle receptor subunit beta